MRPRSGLVVGLAVVAAVHAAGALDALGSGRRAALAGPFAAGAVAALVALADLHRTAPAVRGPVATAALWLVASANATLFAVVAVTKVAAVEPVTIRALGTFGGGAWAAARAARPGSTVAPGSRRRNGPDARRTPAPGTVEA